MTDGAASISPPVVGVSLKMYFSGDETLRWCSHVAAMALAHPGVSNGEVEVFVLPSYPMLVPAVAALRGTPVRVGAQNLCVKDRGPFTGEVSGAMLAELGCRYVAVGHAERRRLFREDDTQVALKVQAALRNQLCPIICIGETARGDAASAAETCVAQLRLALVSMRRGAIEGPLLVAYEPQWAIGVERPAGPEHIRVVVSRLREHLEGEGWGARAGVIYGGSAGAGLMAQLGGVVDGLFLGRRAHDPSALTAVIDEIMAHASRAARASARPPWPVNTLRR